MVHKSKSSERESRFLKENVGLTPANGSVFFIKAHRHPGKRQRSRRPGGLFLAGPPKKIAGKKFGSGVERQGFQGLGKILEGFMVVKVRTVKFLYQRHQATAQVEEIQVHAHLLWKGSLKPPVDRPEMGMVFRSGG
jgi:hypothetical protein